MNDILCVSRSIAKRNIFIYDSDYCYDLFLHSFTVKQQCYIILLKLIVQMRMSFLNGILKRDFCRDQCFSIWIEKNIFFWSYFVLFIFNNFFCYFSEIAKVRASLFQINGVKKEPLKLPEPDGTPVTLNEKVYVPVKEHPDVSTCQKLRIIR